MVGLVMWKVYFLLGIVVIVVALLWVSGIDYMQKNYPDYKGGNNDGFDFDDEIKDWDVTVIDGLDELEEQEKFYYCQLQIEQDKWCKTQCDHCKKYYKPLEDELKKEKGL